MKTPTSTDPKDWALHYALRFGWHVLPCHAPAEGPGGCTCGKKECSAPGKHPAIAKGLKEASGVVPQIKAWWEKFPFANVALATGRRFWVLDVEAEGEETIEEFQMRHGALPDTPIAQTGGGGRHFYFALPEGAEIRNAQRPDLGIDVRGIGGYVMAPPSLHLSGRRYEWEIGSEPWTVEPAIAPDWLLEAMGGSAGTKTGNAMPEGKFSLEAALDGVGQGERDLTLFRLASYCRASGMPIEDAKALASQCAAACRPPFPDRDAERKVDWVYKHYREGWSEDAKAKASGSSWDPGAPPDEPPTATIEVSSEPEPTKPYEATELGNAHRFRDMAVDVLRWCNEYGCWLGWDGTRWVADRTGGTLAMKIVHGVLKDLRQRAVDMGSKTARDAAWKFSCTSQSRSAINAMMGLAKTLDGMGVVTDDLDADPYLLNTPGGVIDLQTGELSPHSSSRLITKITSVAPDFGTEAKEWARFVYRAAKERSELYNFIKLAAGYSLTGSTGEQVFFFAHGSGANGKSTLIETLQTLMGDYATSTSTEILLASKVTASTTEYELARLKGIRMVAAQETGKGRRLNEERAKVLTGSDTITGRYPYGQPFTYRPQFKLWLSSNHKPDIRGTDRGIWRRVRLIPFDIEIPPDEIIQDYGEKMIGSEGPAILAWLVRGCVEWAANRLPTSESVERSTEEYREEMDLLGVFLAECVEFVEDPDVFCETSTLFNHYKFWCEKAAEHPVTLMRFSLDLKARGFVRDRSPTTRRPGFQGLRPLPSPSYA